MLVVYLSLTLNIGIHAKFVNDIFVQHAFGDDFDFCFGEIAGVFPVEYAEYFNDVLA